MGDAGMLSSGESAAPGKALSVQAGTGSGCFQIRTKISRLLELKVSLILIRCTLPVEGNYVNTKYASLLRFCEREPHHRWQSIVEPDEMLVTYL